MTPAAEFQVRLDAQRVLRELDRALRKTSAGDLLDLAYINSLPQPFMAIQLGGWQWPVHDIEVQTGLVRVDVCGLLDVMTIADFTAFVDASGKVHSIDSFFRDATPEEREPVSSEWTDDEQEQEDEE